MIRAISRIETRRPVNDGRRLIEIAAASRRYFENVLGIPQPRDYCAPFLQSPEDRGRLN